MISDNGFYKMAFVYLACFYSIQPFSLLFYSISDSLRRYILPRFGVGRKSVWFESSYFVASTLVGTLL